MTRVDEITEGSRVKWLENRSNIESAQSEGGRTRIWFSVTTEKKVMQEEKDYESAECVSKKRRGRTECSSCCLQKIKILWCMDTKFTLCRIISEYQMQQTANSRTGSRYSTLSLLAYTLWLVSHWTMHIHQSVFTIPMVMNRQYDALFGIKVNMKWILSAVQNNTYTIRMSLGRMHTSAKDEAMSHTVIIIMIYVLD